jgi:putative transposase
MHIEYRPSYDISSIVKLINERSLRKLQMEFPELKKDIWVVIFRLLVLDVGVQKILQMK